MELSITRSKSGKINIFTDGEFRFAVSSDVWYILPYKEGDNITEFSLENIKITSDYHDAKEKALRLLSLREHTEAELYTKLRYEYPEETALSVSQYCVSEGLIDDERFAVLYADELWRRKSFAPERIIREIEYRGVDKNTAEKAVLALDIDRDSGIIKILDKIKITNESSEKDKARAIRKLLTSGYNYCEISTYLK